MGLHDTSVGSDVIMDVWRAARAVNKPVRHSRFSIGISFPVDTLFSTVVHRTLVLTFIKCYPLCYTCNAIGLPRLGSRKLQCIPHFPCFLSVFIHVKYLHIQCITCKFPKEWFWWFVCLSMYNILSSTLKRLVDIDLHSSTERAQAWGVLKCLRRWEFVQKCSTRRCLPMLAGCCDTADV